MKEPQKRAFTRIKELDILRGVAAMEVMFSHYTGSYDYQHGLKNSLGFSVTDGNYGVFLFFAISGFVILLTLQNCATALDFAISRFSRIFPAYWAAILLTSATLAWLAPLGLPFSGFWPTSRCWINSWDFSISTWSIGRLTWS